MNKQIKHTFVTKTDVFDKQVEIKIDIFDLLSDLKVLMNEYYFATFESSEQSLVIGFDNGQRFRLSLEEIHS